MSEEEIIKILSNLKKHFKGTLEENQSSLKDLFSIASVRL